MEKKAIKYKIERELEVSYTNVAKPNTPTHKHKEELIWNESKRGRVVCIGLNPAKASLFLDATNKNLINLIESNTTFSNVGSYTLYNFFSVITKNKAKLYEYKRDHADAVTSNLNVILDDLFSRRIKVILFSGKRSIDDKFLDFIKNDLLYITTTDQLDFIHGSKATKISKVSETTDETIYKKIRGRKIQIFKSN
ncbi:MAG: DUF1643 domain-containing protein [Mycoplasmatota bacterium]